MAATIVATEQHALPDVQRLSLSACDSETAAHPCSWQEDGTTAFVQATHPVPGPPKAGDTLVAAALRVLLQPDPNLKAAWSSQIARLWKSGDITAIACGEEPQPPDTPARPAYVALVQPWETPKLGKGGTLASRLVRFAFERCRRCSEPGSDQHCSA